MVDSRKKILVPKDSENAIQYLLDECGMTESQLAFAWGLRSTNSVNKYRNFNHVPRYRTAARMALTFGWSSPGAVMDYFAARVAERQAS